MSMNADEARGRINQLLYGVDAVRDLRDDAVLARLADSIINHRGFTRPAEEYVEAIEAVLREGHLHEQTSALTRRHMEPELLDFLRRLAARLFSAVD
jgi:hypothetical protein